MTPDEIMRIYTDFLTSAAPVAIIGDLFVVLGLVVWAVVLRGR